MEGQLLLNLYDSKHQSLGVSQSVYVCLSEDKVVCFSNSSRSKPLFSFDLHPIGAPTSKVFTLTSGSSNVSGEFICPTNSIKQNWVSNINERVNSSNNNNNKHASLIVSPKIRTSIHQQDVLKTPKTTPHYMKPISIQSSAKKTIQDTIFINNPMNVTHETGFKPRWIPGNFGNNSWSSRKLSPSNQQQPSSQGQTLQSPSTASIYHRDDDTLQFVDMGNSPALSVSHGNFHTAHTNDEQRRTSGSVMDRFSISELRELLISIPSHIREALLKDSSSENNNSSNNHNYQNPVSPPRVPREKIVRIKEDSESDLSHRRAAVRKSIKAPLDLGNEQSHDSKPVAKKPSSSSATTNAAVSRLTSKPKIPVTKTVSKGKTKKTGNQSFFEFLSKRRPATVIGEPQTLPNPKPPHLTEQNASPPVTNSVGIVDKQSHEDNNNNNMTDLAEWQRMTNWLYSIGMGMYIDNFRQSGITKLSVVEMLTYQDMINMGISKESDVRFIIQKISEFTERTKCLSEQVLFSSSEKLKSKVNPLAIDTKISSHYIPKKDVLEIRNVSDSIQSELSRIPLFPKSQSNSINNENKGSTTETISNNPKKELIVEEVPYTNYNEGFNSLKANTFRKNSDNELIDSFNRDDIVSFFNGWDRLTIDIHNDRIALSSAKQAMEFYLYLHFYIVVPITLKKEQNEIDNGRDVVRKYLATIVTVNDDKPFITESDSPMNGQPSPFFKSQYLQFPNSPEKQRAPFQSTKEFAILAGIVYVPNPHHNKLYTSLFKPDWKEGLRNRLILFLNSYSNIRSLGDFKSGERNINNNVNSNISSPENPLNGNFRDSASVDLIFDNGNNYVEFSPCPSVVSQLTDNSKDNALDDPDNNKVYKKLLNNRWFTKNEDKVINNNPNTIVMSKKKRSIISDNKEVKRYEDSNSENYSQKVLMKQVSMYNNILKKKKIEVASEVDNNSYENNITSKYKDNSENKEIVIKESNDLRKEEESIEAPKNNTIAPIRPKINLTNCKLLSQLLPSTDSNQSSSKPTAAIALEDQFTKIKNGNVANNIPKLFNDLLNKKVSSNSIEKVDYQAINENSNIDSTNNRNQLLPRHSNLIDDEDDEDNIKVRHQVSNEISESVDLLDISDYSNGELVTKKEDFDEIYFNR